MSNDSTNSQSVNQKADYSASAYAFELEESPRDNYTQVPNIVMRMKLKPSTFMLYVYYRSIGKCFKKQETIAADTGLSLRTIRDSNQELAMARPELGGKSLILIQANQKQDGGKAPNTIIIRDIWKENHEFFNPQKDEELKKSLRSANFAGGIGKFCRSNNKIPSNKKDTYLERTPMDGENSDASRRVGDARPKNGTVQIPQALKDMAELGLSLQDQHTIAQNYSEFAIQKACEDMFKFKLGVSTEISNLAAFITKACQDYDYTLKHNLPASHVWEMRKKRAKKGVGG